MFDSCTGLVSGPKVLPATTLAATCYRNMFYNCSSLTNAPLLPALTASNCYQRMFYGCSSLSVIKMKVSKYSASNFASDGTTWVEGVNGQGTIYLNSALPNSSGYAAANVVPAGWDVVLLDVNSEAWNN